MFWRSPLFCMSNTGNTSWDGFKRNEQKIYEAHLFVNTSFTESYRFHAHIYHPAGSFSRILCNPFAGGSHMTLGLALSNSTRCLERFFFSCAARKSTILNITTRGHMKWYFTNLDRRISFPTAALPEWGLSHHESLIQRSAIGPKRATSPLISVSRDHPGCTIYNYTLYILYTSSLLYKMSNLEN